MSLKLAEALLLRRYYADLLTRVEGIDTDLLVTGVNRSPTGEPGMDSLHLSVPVISAIQVEHYRDWLARQLRHADSAIQQANWSTEVTVGGKAMKLAEALTERKGLIDQVRRLRMPPLATQVEERVDVGESVTSILVGYPRQPANEYFRPYSEGLWRLKLLDEAIQAANWSTEIAGMSQESYNEPPEITAAAPLLGSVKQYAPAEDAPRRVGQPGRRSF